MLFILFIIYLIIKIKKYGIYKIVKIPTRLEYLETGMERDESGIENRAIIAEDGLKVIAELESILQGIKFINNINMKKITIENIGLKKITIMMVMLTTLENEHFHHS